MGNAGQHKKKKHNAANRHYRRTFMNLRVRGRDIDNIQDDLKAVEEGKDLKVVDADAPGGGLYYCVPCARHFIDGGALAIHQRGKPHKKRLRIVAEPQYTHREADAGAGMSAPDTASA